MRNGTPALGLESGLASYLKQISQYPMLDPHVEQDLARRVRDHADVDAAHTLVTSHLRLVAKIAFKMKGYGIAVMDLISEGNIGLMHAVKKFDPDLGHRLSTYAMWWIKAFVHDFIIKTKSLVRLGTTAAQKRLFFGFNKAKKRLIDFDINSRSLSEDQISSIAEDMSVTTSDVRMIEHRFSASETSLDMEIDEDRSLIDTVRSSEELHDEVLANAEDAEFKRKLMYESMSRLLPREKEVLLARHTTQNPTTLEVLSEKYGVSRERVRQIEGNALKKMKAYCQANLPAIC